MTNVNIPRDEYEDLLGRNHFLIKKLDEAEEYINYLEDRVDFLKDLLETPIWPL